VTVSRVMGVALSAAAACVSDLTGFMVKFSASTQRPNRNLH
jgi:hypothetical protein